MNENKLNKAHIYKLVVDGTDTIYVGKTANLNVRKSNHKQKCFYEKGKSYNLKVYKIIREEYGVVKSNFNERVKIIWIEDVEYKNRYELSARECFWKCKLNTRGNMLTPYENAHSHKERQKIYYEKNKEARRQYGRKYWKENKDKIHEQQKRERERKKRERERYELDRLNEHSLSVDD